MIFFKFSLTLQFCLGILFLTSQANANIFSELNAINYANLIQKINFDEAYEIVSKRINFQSDSKQNIVDGYDDSKCVQQFSELQRSLNESEMWAIEVMDASGKTPSGILSGNTFSMGDFDQCLAVKHEIISDNVFYGQYCRMEAFVNNISEIYRANIKRKTYMLALDIDSIETEPFTSTSPRRLPRPTPTNILTYGICGPATCSPEMLTKIIAEALEQSDINYVSNISISPISCQKQANIKLRTEDILAISFFGLIVFLMLGSTIYDIIKTRQEKPKNEALIAFSVYTNTKKIFASNQTKSSNEITCLHGLRSLSMYWVLTSHLYDQHWYMPISNANYLFEWITKYYSMVILSTNKAVDTFLFMSALLLTWPMLKQLRNNKGKFNYVLLYVHRYLRVTPLLAVGVLYTVTFFKYSASGPFWPDVVFNLNRNCRNNWWPTLLYIQNYYNPTQMCLPHFWYLSADMQLYILSPPFIYLLFRYKNKIIPILLSFCIASSGIVIYFFIKYDFDITLITTSEGNLSNDLRKLLTYHPTHARAGSWIVGVIFGYILFLVDGKKVHMKKRILYFGWPASILILLGAILANYPLQQIDQTTSSLLNGLYHAIPRIAWPVALSFIIFACHFGYGGIINWFLSLSQWQPISRLTYSMYIIHATILLILERQNRTSRYYSDFIVFHSSLGHLLLSVMVAFIFSLAFEHPVFVLEKLLLTKPASERGKETVMEN